jgi:hypothetical protein
MYVRHDLENLRTKAHIECWIWNPLTLFRSIHKNIKLERTQPWLINQILTLDYGAVISYTLYVKFTVVTVVKASLVIMVCTARRLYIAHPNL